MQNELCTAWWGRQLPCQSVRQGVHGDSWRKGIVFSQSGRPMATPFPFALHFVFLPVRLRVVPVIIPNRVPVMIGKYEYDRRRNADSNTYQGLNHNATPVSAAMDDTTGNKHRSYEQGRPIGSARNQRVIGFCRQ